MIFVKVCGITNLLDARAAVEAGADALGFNFYRRSARFIEPLSARRIIEQLPQGILSVGVFVNEGGPETVARIADEACVGAVQLHGDETPAYCRALKGRMVIKALRVGQEFVPSSAAEYETDAILLDAFDARERGGTGCTLDWKLARKVRELVPKLFLAGGLSPANIAHAIATVGPYAVDACSLLEDTPGHKNHQRLRAFIRAAKAVTSDE
ncbi:MAG TPA: phosphoribosylanthranilate isomerase [Pyrinomonadaceae bacterium]|jgi:phosphoribosylanthranilate isomerase|nr:phosphoribosylanthranilate isomerase [Pyrinomonadaceae bacterium]